MWQHHHKLRSKNKTHLLFHSSCGSKIQILIVWILCKPAIKQSPISKFDWGKSPFQVHMVVDRIQALQARGLRASVSCQLLTQVCSQFLDGFVQKPFTVPWHMGLHHMASCYIKHIKGLPEWQCMILCKVILKISYCLCNILLVGNKSLVMPTLKKGIIQTVRTRASSKENWNHPRVWLVKPTSLRTLLIWWGPLLFSIHLQRENKKDNFCFFDKNSETSVTQTTI